MHINWELADSPLPARFADLKREIASSIPDFEARATKAWGDIIAQLKVVNQDIGKDGSEYIPQVNFADLKNLAPGVVDKIKRRGSVVIKDVISDDQVKQWKEELKEFVTKNADVDGLPENDKQFFNLYWTKPQVEARAHPNLLSTTVWLNNLYHTRGKPVEGVDLNTPLTYADRFRIRKAGVSWAMHPPHIDGGTIERWEEPNFRKCFESILSGDWKAHDPYDIEGRLNANTSLYGRAEQSSVFRTFQGWLAMSETAPTEGTLRVYPDVLLSNAYITLRPFFSPKLQPGQEGWLDAENWVVDTSTSVFHGIHVQGSGYAGPRPAPATHPHLDLELTMTSVPKVLPGDMVFWHCDVVHSVEQEHNGSGDSAVMYIPAVPLTPQNQEYIQRQADTFHKQKCPPDFPQGPGEDMFVGVGVPDDVKNPVGRRAMGLSIASVA